MSIDAVVIDVVETGDDPRLILGPRVTAAGHHSIPGQKALRVRNRPCPPLRGLIGYSVWGGSSQLMLGNNIIAHRVGYTGIDLIERKATP